MKKVLIVGMPFSIYSARWISMLKELNLEIHFFSSFPYSAIHPELNSVIYHNYFYCYQENTAKTLIQRDFKNRSFFVKNQFLARWIGKFVRRIMKLEKSPSECLHTLIQTIKPDIIHTMETQHAGYLMNEIYQKVRSNSKLKGMVWMHQTYGIDIDYYGNFKNHAVLLKELFARIDFFLVEGQRDFASAERLGYRGRYAILPAGGGYPIDEFIRRKRSLPSSRKKIFIKGYQDSVRRGLVAIRAIVKCKELLSSYEICVFSCAREVKDYIEYVNSKEGMSIKIEGELNYDGWLDALAEARISITNNLSDGLPSWLFESMLLGVFPIQSESLSSHDWIESGVSAFVVHPEEPEMIKEAITQAVLNDEFIDKAAEINFHKIASNLEFFKVKNQALSVYRELLNT